jgi:hypothetical protein
MKHEMGRLFSMQHVLYITIHMNFFSGKLKGKEKGENS